MVAVSIVGLFTLVAVPNFKRVHQDFRTQRTLSDADTLIQSYRSYYLIHNQFPDDRRMGHITEDFAYFLPSNFFEKRRVKVDGKWGYPLTLSPFYDSNSSWDFNNWITWSKNKAKGCMYLSVKYTSGDSATRDTQLNFFKKHYSLSTPQPFYYNQGDSCHCLPFPEFPPKSKLDSVSKNRYY